MTDSKATPGPWTIIPHQDGGYMLCPPDGRCAYMALLPDEDSEDKANALLISKAPELRDALRNIVDCYGVGQRDAKNLLEHLGVFIGEARALLSTLEDSK